MYLSEGGVWELNTYVCMDSGVLVHGRGCKDRLGGGISKSKG